MGGVKKWRGFHIVKSRVDISINPSLWDEAKNYGINRSKICEEALMAQLNLMKGDVRIADKLLIKHKLERKQSELNRLQGEVSALRVQLDQIDKLENQSKEEALEQEKNQIESIKKCRNCGNIIEDTAKKFDFPIGSICHNCYMHAHKEDISRWTVKRDDNKY